MHRRTLDLQYSGSYWGVFLFDQRGDWSVNIGRKQKDASSSMDEQALWKDESATILGREAICTLYIWKALKSHSRKLRPAKNEEMEKIEKIKSKIIQKKGQAPQKEWKVNQWTEELVQELDAESLPWRHLVIAEHLSFKAGNHSLFYLHNLDCCICFST